MKKKPFNRRLILWVIFVLGAVIFAWAAQNPMLWFYQALPICIFAVGLSCVFLIGAPIWLLLHPKHVGGKKITSQKPQLGTSYILGDDGEIIEMGDDEKAKRGVESKLE